MSDFLAGQILRASDLNSHFPTDSWHAPTPGSLWSNYGAGYNNLGYRKDADGVVSLRGLVQTVAPTDTGAKRRITTLPSGYRPIANWLMTAFGDVGTIGGSVRLNIEPSGDITIADADADMDINGIWVYLSLDGLQFATT